VASDFDRGESIDRLLTGASRGQAGPDLAGSACVDAEMFAAWAEGTLPADRALEVERHLAGCARCQAMAAVFARADAASVMTPEVAGAAPASVVPFTPRRPMRWLVPIAAGTVAATLLVWTAVRNLDRFTPDDTMARSTAAGPAAEPVPASPEADARQTPAAAPSAGGAAAAPEAKITPEANAATAGRQARLEPAPKAELAVTAPAAAAATPPPARETIPTAPPGAVGGVVGGVAAPPPPPPAAAPRPAAAQADTRAVAEAAQLAVDPTLVVAEFSSQTSVIVRGASPAVQIGAGRGGRGGGAGGGAAAAKVAAPAQAPAATRWRIFGSGRVERSTDNGATWEAAIIEPSATGLADATIPPVTGLTGGAAPSPLTCWLIGRAGLVLMTTDGRRFTRVTAPTTADLISVQAIDALQATVTTAGGQVFVTTDGGKSWTSRGSEVEGEKTSGGI